MIEWLVWIGQALSNPTGVFAGKLNATVVRQVEAPRNSIRTVVAHDTRTFSLRPPQKSSAPAPSATTRPIRSLLANQCGHGTTPFGCRQPRSRKDRRRNV